MKQRSKKLWIGIFAFLVVIGGCGMYVIKNVPLRMSIIRTFAKGGWYIESEGDTIYTMGYFGVRKYHCDENNELSLLASNDTFCKNTLIARSAIIDGDLIYVICRSFLSGIYESGDKDYTNGALIVLNKSNLSIKKQIPASIKYVEGQLLNDKLILSGILGYDIYDVTNRYSPVLAYEYRTPKRSEFQGVAAFQQDSCDYVVFSRYTEGIQIWNVTDARASKEVAFVPMNSLGLMSFDVVVDYPYVYSTVAPDNGAFGTENDKRGIAVYNISDFENITSTEYLVPKDQWYSAKVGDKEPTCIEKYQNEIFVNFADKGVAIFDVTNPSQANFVQTLNIGNDGGHVQPFHITEMGLIVSGNYWWDDIYVYKYDK